MHITNFQKSRSHSMFKNTINLQAKLVLAAMAFVSHSWAACPSNPNRFSGTGAEVTDTQTGLVWARCSAGQTSTGSGCSGPAASYTHEQALAYATSQSGWRLPNRKELSSLVDTGCQFPSIDAKVFPGTNPDNYWTSSPYAATGTAAWFVHFGVGVVLGEDRSMLYAVRLVRASL
jgi:hypothetical protein